MAWPEEPFEGSEQARRDRYEIMRGFVGYREALGSLRCLSDDSPPQREAGISIFWVKRGVTENLL